MRILLMADTSPSPNSGAAGTDYQGAMALRRAGHKVQTVWADELSHHIRHYNLRYLLELPWSYRAVMQDYLRKKNFDVVQISQPHGYLAAKALAESGSPAVFVHRSHGFEPRVRDDLKPWHRQYGQSRPLYRRFASAVMSDLLERNNRMIARHADGHLVSASQCAEYLMSVYSVAESRIATVPQAVPDAYLIGARPIDSARLKQLLYVGQYAFIKAPMILAAAVSRLLESRPDLSFTWVCSANHHAQALAHCMPSVRDRITLLDWMPQEQLIEVYDRHGLFLFPSFFEGFGKAFLEAMSRGLVVVAADNGGMKDVIKDGINGFKVPTGDSAAIVQRVEKVISDPILAASISVNAIQTAGQFTWDQFAHASTQFYESLIRQKAIAHRSKDEV